MNRFHDEMQRLERLLKEQHEIIERHKQNLAILHKDYFGKEDEDATLSD